MSIFYSFCVIFFQSGTQYDWKTSSGIMSILANDRPYFENYMYNIQAFRVLNCTSLERYCTCGHFEYKQSSIRSFWSKIWSKEGPNYTQFCIFVTDKIDFYHKFISLLWQNCSVNRSDIGLGTVNLFLYCEYLINFLNGEKTRITPF